MNNKSVSMQDIANKLGITKVSVSKALSGQPGISNSLKNRIITVAKEMGYEKNTGKQPDLQVKRLGFLVSKRFFVESDNFYTTIYYYLGKECANRHIQLVLYIISPDDENRLTLPFSLKNDNLDGLFLAGEVSDKYIDNLMKINIPMVAVDFYQPLANIDCIVFDNFYSSYMATLYLIKKGHKKIGFVGNPKYTSSVADRFYGYLKALSQNSISFNNEWHIINNDLSGIYTEAYALPDNLPTAFICHCDMAAHNLILRLRLQGISVPGQVSLISFDNTPLSQKCDPPLTTIDIDIRKLSSKSLQQMLHRIDNALAEPQKISLGTRLIERDSVKTYDILH